ncbi:ATP-binding cassette, subfamily B [Marivirga sericea]|uniref:ATP-binding cassette, subfamily B n=1 Tax=Marivirga sericea TaxID=1028 RepID=A0A1X7LFA1_9BACT|nr:ABC transporter ATP-binding protein [Marivirga sericea]SMG52546.1 ATP-binding cassette, subfamily B [Marivirga sericea]
MKKDNIKSGNIIDTNVLKRLYKFVKPYQGRFYFLVFLTLALAVLAPTRPFIIQKAIDNPIANGDFQGLINMTLILVGLLIMQAIVQYGHTYLSGWLGQYIIRDIRLKLYRHLLSLRLKFFDKTPIGRLVTRNVSDVETLSDVFSQGLAAMIGDILQILFILGMMLAMSWKLTLVSLATLPLLFLSTYIFKEKVKVAFNQVRNAVSNLNSFVQEHVTGMSIVQIFTAEKREYDEFKKINNEHKKANIRSVLYYSIYFPVAEVIQATGIGLLVWYGARGVVNEAESGITLGMLIAFILYIQMFFRPIRLIADRFNTLQMGIVSSSRILNLLDNSEHIPNNGSFKPEKIKGDISFQNVEFSYNEEEVVLKNISFEVKQGQSVALVGATGAGKSSVINLLSRFYDIQKGQISLDGRDLQDYDLYSLRQNIGVVLQDVFLFSDTILYNITLGNPNISLQQVKDAAELVGARKFIERLPGAYEYNVMERGATLSVGQRQLISFVRAVVYNPKIIVLDEATSSVDTETEELIQNAIEKMMKGRTSIVIAHRLSTIQEADKIIVLDKGEIKETGTHQELLDKGGFYHQLHNMQYKEVAS